MIKLSGALAVIGLALLLMSALPGQAAPVAPAAAATSIPAAAATSIPAVPAPAEIAYGKALFSAKGCVVCHHHAGIAGSGTFSEGNPDLSTYRWSADYLRTWLKDPAAVKPNTYMPNLGLKHDEIEALIAFLSASK